jgi:tetratricopeptide (TPR) repeat protein
LPPSRPSGGITWRAALEQLDPAVADYSRAIDLGAEGFEVWQERAKAYVRQARWDKATPDYRKAANLGAGPNDLCAYAEESLRRDDTAEYRRACAVLVEAFGRTRDPAAARSVCWTCVLAPDAVPDPTELGANRRVPPFRSALRSAHVSPTAARNAVLPIFAGHIDRRI